MTPAASRSVAMAVRVYAAACRLLPAVFREAYGARLTDCFREIATDARTRGRLALALTTARALGDLVFRALGRRSSAVRPEPSALGRGLVTDVRHAARRLRRRPVFAIAAIVTLGLGLGSATAVFSLVHGVVLNGLPFPEADRLVTIDHAGPGVGAPSGLGITYGFYRFYREQVPGVDAWALYVTTERTLVGRGDPVALRGAAATPSLTDVLRVPAAHGRWFSADEGRTVASPIVVLSDRLWRERFDGDPGIVGERIDFGGESYEVIGVMPASFQFPSAVEQFWVPRVVPDRGVGGWSEHAIARLSPGATPGSIEREIVARYPQLRETTDDPARVNAYLDDAKVAPRIAPLRDALVADVRLTLWILLAAVGAVLAIAVANVTNLFLIRAEDTQREMAVRRALGAGRGRLVRSSLVESLLVTGAAGAFGLVAAALAIRIVQAQTAVHVPRLSEVGLTWPVLVATAVAVVVTGCVLGLAPFLRRRRSTATMPERTRAATASRGTRRGRDVLVAAQVALALLLLIGSGLLVRTYAELRRIDLGFTEREALAFDLGLPGTRYQARADAVRFHRDRLAELGHVPGVRAAGAVAQCLPLSGNMCWGDALELEGRPTPPGTVPPITGVRVASREYFRAMGIAVRGRTFTAADEHGVATVIILSEAAAAAYVPGGDPIGRRIRFGSGADSSWHTIVGVAADVRGDLQSDRFQRLAYLPMLDEGRDGPPPARMTYVVAASVPAESLAGAVRTLIAGADPLLPLGDLRTLQSVVDRATAPTGFALALIGLSAAIALVLGAVGVYAVVAYAVSRRTAEIGVRMAIGATPADVRRLVGREGGLVVLAGVAVGLAAAVGLGRFVQGQLYKVTATDPATLVTLTVVMLGVAAAALAIPARRASRVDPTAALRSD